MNSQMNSRGARMAHTRAALAAVTVNQEGASVKRPAMTLSTAAASIRNVPGYGLRKPPGATANSSTATLSAPRCDANSLAMMAARSRSWGLPGRPGPASAQIVLTMSRAYWASSWVMIPAMARSSRFDDGQL